MNLRLFLMKGLQPAHRAVFITGVMAYLSAPLWLLALILATALVVVQALTLPQYFVQPFQLFPLWPEWRPERAIALLSITFGVLFLPKILASLLVQAKGFGGRVRLALSVIVECVLSALLAPVRMLFHSQFVLASLLGRAVRWRSPARSDARTDWTQALRRHGVHTMIGIAWTGLVWRFDPQFLPWLLPIVGAFMLSVPLSVFTSHAGAGRVLRRLGLFVIPEEVQTPAGAGRHPKVSSRGNAWPRNRCRRGGSDRERGYVRRMAVADSRATLRVWTAARSSSARLITASTRSRRTSGPH